MDQGKAIAFWSLLLDQGFDVELKGWHPVSISLEEPALARRFEISIAPGRVVSGTGMLGRLQEIGDMFGINIIASTEVSFKVY